MSLLPRISPITELLVLSFLAHRVPDLPKFHRRSFAVLNGAMTMFL
jgi:hypothetical protein